MWWHPLLTCLFLSFQNILAQFQYSSEKVLPSDTLRSALAKTFQDERRFQLGVMDVAAECFVKVAISPDRVLILMITLVSACLQENILMRIHFHMAEETKDDVCMARHCIPHQKFSMMLLEQVRACSGSGTAATMTTVNINGYLRSSWFLYQQEHFDSVCVSVCVQQLWGIITTSTLQSDGSLHLHHLTVVSV